VTEKGARRRKRVFNEVNRNPWDENKSAWPRVVGIFLGLIFIGYVIWEAYL